MISFGTRIRLIAASALGVGLLAIVVAVGLNSDGSMVLADSTTTPTKIANDGNLAGVADLLVGDLTTGVGYFYCIVKIDHASSNNEIKTSSQCNIDVPDQGATSDIPPPWSDACEAIESANPGDCPEGSLNISGEPGPDLLAGPVPPPPYTVLPPSKGYGAFYPSGAGAPLGAGCGSTDCTVVTSCFEDVGSLPGIGPNIIATVVIFDPKNTTTVAGVDQVASGEVDIWYNQNIANCKAGTPKGAPAFESFAVDFIEAYDKGGANPNPNPAPWRDNAPGTVLDFDGDGCSDEAELEEVKVPTGKCGDDPQNPFDSFDPNTVDLSGIYHITTRLSRADCTTAQCDFGLAGNYIYCRADLQHDTNDDSLVMRPYCYADNTAVDINPEGYPGTTGDGMPGGPPPGPDTGGGNYVFGDVDGKHAELTGTFSTSNPPSITVAGCIEDPDGSTGTGDVWFEITGSAHMLPGQVSIWLFHPDCDIAPVIAPTLIGDVFFAKQPGATRDDDVDGNPTAAELGDDSVCGRRDPYNPNDYYDVSIPRDGVIDLSNDILGVILHFAPGGYPAGDENWDRPGSMTNAEGGHWNRGSPDGVIDLSNDILGVILQFNPGGC